ncbi:DsbA family protein [Mycolicibacterium komossense]|uniref:Thioredoxin domain-containing protein n=1 Tax=Mycolicibacterium komossense TaxID=1779 RepID=A0ABT3CM80_9MYCO|nr:thioredoxin domain-containing protein [Mycolicibacterium komossense]MCV7230371.1 thioredoxin domain-containing protein [Mycolicibacterium komossense]
MRYLRKAIALTAAAALTLTGCSREVDGVARPDPHQPGVAATSDGFGIVAGFADAPVQLEIFTEPQCSHCAHLQATFGEDIKRHIESGELSVTYRPMTFLDDQYEIDYSAVVTNALFLAVEPSTTAATFQNFVEDLWANQQLSSVDYTNEDFAGIARESGLSDHVVARIGDGDSAVDTDELAAQNETLLSDESPESPGTPVVYNLKQHQTVDISDDAWLDHLLQTT